MMEATTRRAMLTGLAATAAGAIVPGAVSAATGPDPRVAAIVRDTIGIDTHNHIDVPLNPAGPRGPAVDMAGELRRSGLSAICMTFAVDYGALDRPGAAQARFAVGMDAMDAVLRANGMTRALTFADILAAHAARRPTVVQAVEGCHFLEGRIERLSAAYARGLRHLGLLHDNDAAPPLGDVYTNPPRFGGLSPFGRDVVREANRLGMVVDLAHGSADTVRAALALSTTPVLVSHTGLDTVLGDDPTMARMMRPRLIAAGLAREIAAAGGVIGVWTHLSATPGDYARNIRAMVDVVGVDHVCIGTDTKLTPAFDQGDGPWRSPGVAARRPPCELGRRPETGGGGQAEERTSAAWAGQTQGFYDEVVAAMLKTDFSAEEIGRIGGGNYLRLLDGALPA